MIFGLKCIKKDTPDKVKRVCDAINGALGSISLATLIANYPNFALGIICVSLIVKAISIFFAEE